MKVAIITTYSLQVTPYVDYYAELFRQNGIDYIIINKETSLLDAKCPEQRVFLLRKKGTFVGNPVFKTIAWYNFVRKTLKKEKCDFVVIVPTRTAMVLSPLLLFTRRSYIFDIRDYTRENKWWFRLIEKSLIKRSKLTVISSNGFRRWLPKSEKLSTIHNMPYHYQENFSCNDLKNKSVITIGYVGCIDYEYQNTKIMEALGNNQRFVLQYSGIVASKCRIEQVGIEMKLENVKFTGKFDNRDKKSIYEQVDVINAVYGNNSLVVSTALPNKLYDALIYKKPIIASRGTYLGELIERYGVGFSIDVDKDNIEEKISKYVSGFDVDCFLENCAVLLKQCVDEQEGTVERIKKLLGHANN